MDDQLPSASDLAGLPSFTALTAEESQFVYGVEVLGLPIRVAARQAGMPLTMAAKPHLQQARELLRREVRGNLMVTKDDVTFGIKEAIERARILGEPMTEIAGWDRLIKLHGLDAPQKIDVNITATMAVLKTHVQNLSDTELANLVGADRVIDGDFYRVQRENQ